MNILSPPITNYTVTLTSPGLQTDTQYIPHVGCNCPYSLTRPAQSGSHLYTVSVTATNSVGQSTNNPYMNICKLLFQLLINVLLLQNCLICVCTCIYNSCSNTNVNMQSICQVVNKLCVIMQLICV